MLTAEQNQKLVQVDATSSMGKLLRLYWIPFYPSDTLEPDGPPKRVKLLGEDLVVFRNTDGEIGLVANRCPHRGAPLMFGRNEQGGLRCVYHGWKFDVSGAVLETPAEPDNSRVKDRACVKAYPVRERNGIAWAYLGPDQDDPPGLPDVEWNLVPRENVHFSFRVQECNWVQALEGELDSAHAAILHGRIDNQGSISDWVAARDLQPTFEIRRQPFGLSVASRRNAAENGRYWRVNQFMMPFWTLVPPQSKYPELSGHAWVPIDDEHTLCLMFTYTPATPLYPKAREMFENGYKGRETGHPSRNAFVPKPVTTPYADFWTRYTLESGYEFDYQSQQTTWFSGLPGLWVQDSASQAGVDRILDRTAEHLCVSDTGIVMTRRLLLESASAHDADGTRPQSATQPESFLARAVSLHLEADDIWHEAGAEHMRAELGKDFGYQP
jgi:phenylpropionate dioxygenase-like ring-hydroxylating dioxygenase large terminal subunit